MKKLFIIFVFLVSKNISYGQWIEQPTPPVAFNLFSCSFPSANTGFAVGYGGRMIRTTNGGSNWYNISIFPTTANDNLSVCFINENSGWMTSTNDTLYRTTDAGVTWTRQQKLTSDGQKIFFINSVTGWILVQPNLYRTTDSGNNWTIINSSSGQYFTFLNENTGWMADYIGGGSTISKTTDGGFTWNTQYTTADFRVIYALEFVNENTGWAAGYREHILKTTNSGVNWTQQRDMGNSTPLVSIDFINANTGWIVSGSGYSLYTINSGNTWNQVFLPSGGGNVKFINSLTGWIVGGKIFKTTTLGLTARNLQLNVLPEGFYNEVGNTMINDAVTVYLRSGLVPYTIIDSATEVVNANGAGSFNFINAVNGENYFIIVKHRNSIDTWSSAAQSFVSNSLAYDFTASSSMAYGNNMKLKGTRWTIYSGDVNKDDFINLTDLIQTYNDAANFQTGYITTDVNGDNQTDLNDIIIVNNNSVNFVTVRKP